MFGRLADVAAWQGYEQRTLPAANIPTPMRLADENLRFQPVLELKQPNGPRAVRIGPRALSYHLVAPYTGWDDFKPELFAAVDELFRVAKGLVVRRLGLRYIDAFTQAKHNFRATDLSAKVQVAGTAITEKFNLNFRRNFAVDTDGIIRVSTKEFVEGLLLPDMIVYTDIDIFTKDGYKATDTVEVKRWVVAAHDFEKTSFFELLTPAKVEELRED